MAHPSPSKESGSKRDQIEKIETDLSREREQFIKFHGREKELLEQLSSLEREILVKRQSQSELNQKLAEGREELEKLRNGLIKTEKNLGAIEGRLAKRLVAFYKFARRGRIQVLSSSRDLEDLSKRARYLDLITGADRRLFQETIGLQQRHKQEILQVREKLGTIERMEKEENDRLLGIKEDLDKKVLVLMKIHKEREFYETAVKELELAAKGLREKLLSLEKAEVKQRDLPTDFETARGRLPPPCGGKVLRSGALGIENSQKGVFILGPDGGEAKSVFPGRIEFSGRLRGYGEIVVINHGSRYFTVTAYLEKRIAEEGNLVKAGEVIGSLGKDDSLAGGRLYFEIRRGGVNLDPIEWLKVR